MTFYKALKQNITGSMTMLILAIVVGGCVRPAPVHVSEQGGIPQVSISNGILNAVIYMPDTANGYYRGSRFDWSGVIPELHYKGHNYFGQWFDEYDPYTHDAIMGPVNDFEPLGFSEALPGESFIKIGIGAFIKADTLPYTFRNQYQKTDAGTWNVVPDKDRIKFTHTLSNSGYAYEYTKIISLEKDQPVMLLTHTIVNHGEKIIETDVYNHNFFVIDSLPTGPDHIVEFPFTLIGQFRRGGEIAEFKDNTIVIHQYLEPGQTVHGGNIEGFGDTAGDYNIGIENTKAGAGVRIRGDKPLSRLVFWGSHVVLSPEPYIHIKALPGEQFTWTIRYTFYTTDERNITDN